MFTSVLEDDIIVSMEFYTSVSRFGNMLLYRGYDSDDKRLEKRVKFKPYLYIPPSKNEPTEFKSLSGVPVKQLDFESMSEMKEFVQTYRGVKDFEFHGTDKHIIAFIQRKFPNEIKFDRRIINVVNIDIETAIGGTKKYHKGHKIKVRMKSQ